MKNVVGRSSFLAVCMLMLFQVSCDDKEKLEAFLDHEKPSMVMNLQTSELGTASLKLQWDAATDNVAVTSYEVFKDEISLGTNNGETTMVIEELSPSTSYNFYVVALDAMENESDPSEPLQVTTPAVDDTQKPTAPSNLESSLLTRTSVTLNWEAATDNVEVVDYEVFQDGKSIGLTQGETTLAISSLTASTAYEYYVVAKDAAGNVSTASNTLSITTLTNSDTEAPQPPTDLRVADVTTTSLVLSWTASTDNETVGEYEIFMEDAAVGKISGTSFNVRSLEPETTYQFKVRAIDNSGNTSEFSQVLEVTTLAAAPTQTVAEIISSRNDLSILNATLSNFDFNLDDEEAGPFTVFAPNNSAFTAFGTLPSGLALNVLIAGHVAEGNHSADELVEQRSITTGASTTLNFSENGTDVIINGNVKIIIKNIQATNGVVHVVDKIITN